MFATYFKLLATVVTRYQGSSVSCVVLDLRASGAHDEVTDNVATIKSANGYWMQYDSNYGTYGCYSSQTGTNPSIYVLK